jgi:hypothetical protein
MQVGDSIVGKRILVGLTYLNDAGEVREQVQYHGFVTKVSDSTIVFERADGNGEFSIPFESEIDTADSEATYTLSCSGEQVIGVELLASWTIHAPETAV